MAKQISVQMTFKVDEEDYKNYEEAHDNFLNSFNAIDEETKEVEGNDNEVIYQVCYTNDDVEGYENQVRKAEYIYNKETGELLNEDDLLNVEDDCETLIPLETDEDIAEFLVKHHDEMLDRVQEINTVDSLGNVIRNVY